jgi:hypothetical protein
MRAGVIVTMRNTLMLSQMEKPAKHFTRRFNYGTNGHIDKDCSRPSTNSREYNWSQGDHKKTCSKFRKTRAVEDKTPKDKGKGKAT